MGAAQALNFIDACLCPYVPEFHNPIVADTAELGLFDRVEGYLLNRG